MAGSMAGMAAGSRHGGRSKKQKDHICYSKHSGESTEVEDTNSQSQCYSEATPPKPP